MLELLLEHVVPEIISLLEIIGVVVITIGAAKAFFYYVNAEILKTVLVRNFEEIYVLECNYLIKEHCYL